MTSVVKAGKAVYCIFMLLIVGPSPSESVKLFSARCVR